MQQALTARDWRAVRIAIIEINCVLFQLIVPISLSLSFQFCLSIAVSPGMLLEIENALMVRGSSIKTLTISN